MYLAVPGGSFQVLRDIPMTPRAWEVFVKCGSASGGGKCLEGDWTRFFEILSEKKVGSVGWVLFPERDRTAKTRACRARRVASHRIGAAKHPASLYNSTSQTPEYTPSRIAFQMNRSTVSTLILQTKRRPRRS